MDHRIGTDISLAKNILMNGGVVAIPTETVYGLAANAFNLDAVTRIFQIKERPSFDPLIVHIGNLDQLEQLTFRISKKMRSLIDHFWPGPLTIVVEKSEKVPDLVTSGLNSVGIRMPGHSLTSRLLNELPFPLAAPSANPFGYVSPTSAQHVADQLGDQVDYILDGGSSKIGLESTIVSGVEIQPRVLRWGGLEKEKIELLIGSVLSNTQSTDNPTAPGMLSSHYAPSKKLILGNIAEMAAKYDSKNVCFLAFKDTFRLPGQTLSPRGDLGEAAQNLFKALRELDKIPQEIILSELVPNEGLGRAINDRLRRAAS